MDMMLKVATVSILAVILGTVVKKETPEQSVLLMICVGVLLCRLLLAPMEEVLNTLQQLAEIAQIDQVFLLPVMKTVAISITTKVTGELCRSGGEGGLATMVEMSGTVLSLVIALPLIEEVMVMMAEML